MLNERFKKRVSKIIKRAMTGDDIYESTVMKSFEFTDEDCLQLCSVAEEIMKDEGWTVPEGMEVTRLEYIPKAFIRDDYVLRMYITDTKTGEILFRDIDALNVWDDPKENKVVQIRNMYKKGVKDKCIYRPVQDDRPLVEKVTWPEGTQFEPIPMPQMIPGYYWDSVDMCLRKIEDEDVSTDNG